jgi:hypothetical protein
MLRCNECFAIKRKRENKVRAVFFVICIVAAVFLASTPYSYAIDPTEWLTPDQINDVTTGVSFGWDGAMLSQGFTPTNGNVAAVKVRLRLGGFFPPGGYDTTINLRSGGPLGPILGSATTHVLDGGGGLNGQFVPFLFSPSVCVSPGQTYFIEWEPPGATILTWMGADNDPNPGPYPGGNAWTGLAESPKIDYCFITYAAAYLIDPAKWADLEFITRIEGGALRSEVRSSLSNPNIGNNLTFIDPNNIASIRVDVTLTDLIYNGDFPRALIHGFFYNDAIGPVRAEIAIGDSGSGLRATYSVGRCPDFNCTTYTPLPSGSGTLGTINLGETHNLFVSWDGTKFDFILDSSITASYTPTAPFPLNSPIPFKAIGTHVTSGAGGFVSALFDDVYVNGTPYDDFSSSGGLINGTKWKHYTQELNQALEIVREQICDGVFGMAVRGYGSFVNNALNLVNGGIVKELQTDLTVEQLVNSPNPNPATPMAGLFGSFYNAGGGPGDSTGDIRALAGIRHNGTQPVGFFNIVRCTAPNCNIYPGEYVRLYYHEDPLAIGPDLVGKPHRVSISYNPSLNKFIFGFDGRPTVPAPSDFTLPLPTRVGPPNVARMGPLTRVAFFSGLSGEGYVSAQFANIATVVDTDGDGVPDSVDNCPSVSNPPVLSWVDINGTLHNDNSQPNFDLDGVGDACDLCPKVVNDGGPCGIETGSATASTSGPLITVTVTYNGPPTYLVPPDCNNVVFNSDKEIPQHCRRIPPYVLTVLEEANGLGSPGGDWKFTAPGTSWTISCNLQDIFDEGALISNSPVKITPMYTFFDTDRGLDPAGNCVNAAQGDVCVDTSQYKLFQGTIPAQEITVATTAFKTVPVDIKPGALPKTINLGSQGNVPVAILSTSDFDATTVNPYTVKIGAASVNVKGKKGTLQESISDANGDGPLDMIVHFDTQALGLTNNAVEICVSGETTGGIRFIGCNPITIVP